jgi:hypothetical protein
MTREEVKAQLAKNPLEWKEEEGRPVYGLHSRVMLIDGEDGDEDAYDALYDVDLTRDAYHVMIDGCDE